MEVLVDFMGFVLGCYGGSGGFCGYFWWRWFCGFLCDDGGGFCSPFWV